MGFLNKTLFISAHQVGDRRFYPAYKKLLQSQWRSYSEQNEDQEKQMKYMIDFAYKHVPYYNKLLKELSLNPSDFKTIKDLEKLPIINKQIIKDNWKDFKPVNLNKMKYYVNSTGGSTGTPFQYRLSKYDRFLGAAMLYRGWGYAGYKLGDKMVFLAGSSLDVGSKPFIIKRSHEILRNLRKLSSFDMSTADMQKYADIINSFKPKYLRGYASAINLLAGYIMRNDIEIVSPFEGVFTTSEKLLPNMRRNIENAFSCDVYDGYGLNDGGISAYECPEHNGFHIDTERSIMEVVDSTGGQMDEGVGSILATSLHNYAIPFIRYDTGDVGHITDDLCSCGRGYKLMDEILGRSVDILRTPEGNYVHGWFLLYIFWEYGKGIKEYQVVQEKLDKLVIRIVPEYDFDTNELDVIREIINRKSNDWIVEFRLVDAIDRSRAGKYKFIISDLI